MCSGEHRSQERTFFGLFRNSEPFQTRFRDLVWLQSEPDRARPAIDWLGMLPTGGASRRDAGALGGLRAGGRASRPVGRASLLKRGGLPRPGARPPRDRQPGNAGAVFHEPRGPACILRAHAATPADLDRAIERLTKVVRRQPPAFVDAVAAVAKVLSSRWPLAPARLPRKAPARNPTGSPGARLPGR